MLWQHDPAQPIGVWEEVREDTRGLFVKGRLLESVARGREAAELIAAGALDGLSIGYRTIKAENTGRGGRVLTELDLWEVSLVTFPMLSHARVAAKDDAEAANRSVDLERQITDQQRRINDQQSQIQQFAEDVLPHAKSLVAQGGWNPTP